MPKKKFSRALARGLGGGLIAGPVGAAAGIFTTGESKTRSEKKAERKLRDEDVRKLRDQDAALARYYREQARIEAQWETTADGYVQLVACSNGHENHPSRTECGVCLAPLVQRDQSMMTCPAGHQNSTSRTQCIICGAPIASTGSVQGRPGELAEEA